MIRPVPTPGFLLSTTTALIIALAPHWAWAADGPLPWSLTPRWESSAGHRGEEWLLAFSRDGKLAFFDRSSGRITARDTTTWKKTGQLLVNEKETEARRGGVVVYSPDGRYCASIAENDDKDKWGWRDIALTDTGTKATLARAAAPHQRQHLLLFSHDGKTLISAAHDAVILWDVPKLQKPRRLGPVNGDPRGNVSRLVLSPDGETLGVTCNYYKNEDQIWDLKAGRMKVALGGHTAQVWSVAFSPDGKALASRGNDPQVKIWDAASGFNTMSIPLDSGHLHRPVAFSPDGKKVATADDSRVRLFDARTGKATLTLTGHTADVNALAFSPDGKQLASASGRPPAGKIGRRGEPGEVLLWDLGAKKARHVWKSHPLGASVVAWSPDGTLVATGGYTEPNTSANEKNEPGHAVFLWDARTGKLVRSIGADVSYGVTLLAFSPDGKWIVHNSDETGASSLRLVDVRTGKEVRSWRVGGAAIAFRKDGAMLASAGGEWIGLWDPRTGKELARHIVPGGDFNTVAFHPDGRSLATGGGDRVIRLWDIVPARKE